MNFARLRARARRIGEPLGSDHSLRGGAEERYRQANREAEEARKNAEAAERQADNERLGALLGGTKAGQRLAGEFVARHPVSSLPTPAESDNPKRVR